MAESPAVVSAAPLAAPPAVKLVSTWLAVQAGYFLLMAGTFGVLFPVIGAVMATFGLVPEGQHPRIPGITMMVAGPCTAVFYLPAGVLSLLARRRLLADPTRALVALLVATVASVVACPLGMVPAVLYVVMVYAPAQRPPA